MVINIVIISLWAIKLDGPISYSQTKSAPPPSPETPHTQ